MINISSFSNPRFKYLKSLTKSRKRKKEGVFLMEGREELDLALKAGLKPKVIAYTKSYTETDYILDTYDVANTEIIQFSKALFGELAYQQVPNNYIAVFESWSADLEQINGIGNLVVLEGLEKPGNLGAIIRTCSAAGIENVVVTESDIDLFNPNVIRNSRGALFNLNVVFTSNAQLLDFFKTKQYRIVATALDDSSKDYRTIKNALPYAIIFGSESKGISNFWIDNSNEKIIIPMSDKLDSLNLSVSVGIILFSLKD